MSREIKYFCDHCKAEIQDPINNFVEASLAPVNKSHHYKAELCWKCWVGVKKAMGVENVP